jgi:hypothetical protein
MNSTIVQETIYWKGVPQQVEGVRVGDQMFVISGSFLRTARPKNEWQDDVVDPGKVIGALQAAPARIDLLKFWQRIPETKPKFDYYKEWQNMAAIPITTYKHWWEKQISPKARNKIRKAQKLGVTFEQTELSDDFVKGVVAIYNQSPVRRGKPFWHYGKDFERVKSGLSRDLADSVFVAAHYDGELIGFIKFHVFDRYAMVTLILDLMSLRDKAPVNGMIAKSVEICAERGIPYFAYTVWRRGDHGHFQKSNGFVKIPVPEYFVPLTAKGRFALRLGLHNGFKAALPEWAMVRLLALRSKWYSLKIPTMMPKEP